MKVTPAKRKIRLGINYALKKINKDMANDPLWKGRFVLRSKNMFIFEYEDHSGYYGSATIEFIDRKTNKRQTAYMSDLDITGAHWGKKVGWALWVKVNDFIVDYCDVWREDPRPSRENAIDYTKIPFKG